MELGFLLLKISGKSSYNNGNPNSARNLLCSSVADFLFALKNTILK